MKVKIQFVQSDHDDATEKFFIQPKHGDLIVFRDPKMVKYGEAVFVISDGLREVKYRYSDTSVITIEGNTSEFEKDLIKLVLKSKKK